MNDPQPEERKNAAGKSISGRTMKPFEEDFRTPPHLRTMRELRKDTSGALDPQNWATVIILLIVVIILVTALIGTLTTQLASYAENETTLGPTVQTIVPILISVGLILATVGALLAYRGGKASL